MLRVVTTWGLHHHSEGPIIAEELPVVVDRRPSSSSDNNRSSGVVTTLPKCATKVRINGYDLVPVPACFALFACWAN